MKSRPTLGKDGKLHISEAVFQSQVIKAARLTGWRIFHALPAMNRRGQWRTAMSGDIGFPDLVMAKAGRIWFVELKTDSGKLTEAQQAWMEALKGNYPTVKAFVLRPNYFDAFFEELKRV